MVPGGFMVFLSMSVGRDEFSSAVMILAHISNWIFPGLSKQSYFHMPCVHFFSASGLERKNFSY